MRFDPRVCVQNFRGIKVLVVGDAMLDSYFHGTSGRLCQEAPVPVVEHCTRHDYAGGAANTAVNVAALAGQSSLVGVTGCDAEGEILRRVLAGRQVEARSLAACPDRRTLTKQRVVSGQQMFVRFDHGTTAPLDADSEERLISSLDEEFLRSDGVIISDYGYGVLTGRIIDRLARLQARSRRMLAVDSKNPTRLQKVGVDVIKPNYREAAALLDLPPATGRSRVDLVNEHAGQLLRMTHARRAVVTLDGDGAVLIEASGSVHYIPAEPVPELLTSGAGDTYLAALALGLISGASLPDAGQIAAAAASVVTRTNSKRFCRSEELSTALGRPAGSSELRKTLGRLQAVRSAGGTIVLTNGCFDILHRGHIAYLNQAKRLGDILVVGVNTDESIRRLKGPERPVNALQDRIEVLSGIAAVDHVVSFDEDTPCRLIEVVRPDVFVKGGDYTRDALPEAELVERLGGRVAILPFLADRSTSTLIERIRNRMPDGRAVLSVKEGDSRDSTAVDRCCESAVH